MQSISFPQAVKGVKSAATSRSLGNRGYPRMGIVAAPCSFIRIHRSVEMAGLLKKVTSLNILLCDAFS